MKQEYKIRIEILDNTLLTFNGVGISGKVISETETDLDCFCKILRRDKNTKKLNAKGTKYEVEEGYFREVWYKNDIVKSLNNKVIKYDETIEKDKKFYRNIPKVHEDRTPIFAIKAFV